MSHWTLTTDADGIAWLRIDRQGASANSLSREVMLEFAERVLDVEKSRPRGLVLASGKPGGFIVGADINEFRGIRTPDEVVDSIREAHALLERLERAPFPSVAAINGACLGGGLELALACRYRVCSDDPKTVLGLPEVLLGIHPGFGGTVRTIRLVGVTAGMDLMLTGKSLRPDKALKIGLVDRLASSDQLEATAREMVLNPPSRRRLPLQERALSWSPIRRFVAPKIAAQVARRARREHYPAPYAMIDLWRRHGARGEAAYAAEARSFGKLVVTPTSRNLVRVFFLQERLKGLGGKSIPKHARLHVVGAGVMGGDIAAWSAGRGFEVTLQDRALEFVQPALERAKAAAEKRARGRDVSTQLARLRADVEGSGVAGADVVLEAIFENVEAKQALYARLEPQLKPGAILATNTSSIMLEKLAPSLADPGRLVGLHFFNPVAQLPLVEVIESQHTRPEVLQAALAFTRAIDKLPLPCRSAPGFLVNRILMPYMTEAMIVAGEGVALPRIDEVAVRFGMPIGPIELADTVGLDVCLHVGRILSAASGRPAPEAIVPLVEQKKLGRKSGEGLYVWKDGKAVKPPLDAAVAPASVDLEDRLILPMVNEAVAILREGVVADEELVDAGVIFGAGFAPFRGGLLRYARERGLAVVHARLLELQSRYGARFSPDAGWPRLLEPR